jgi:type I restriction-modification system DNA methylase subunit
VNQNQLNKEIENFIKQKDKSSESYSASDKKFIQQYEGAGGQGKHGASGEGLLYEFYTPEFVCNLMYKLALHCGYEGGAILDPAIATGRLIEPFYSDSKTNIVGFEINAITARICEICYPKAEIYNEYFETAFLKAPRFSQRISSSAKSPTWLSLYPFDLIIGNPPYGKYKNKYSAYFKKPKMPQIEMMFMYYSLKLLKKGGLLVFISSSNFLKNGITYNNAKDEIGKLADFVDAYRLPPIFKTSKVPTDILILKRK